MNLDKLELLIEECLDICGEIQNRPQNFFAQIKEKFDLLFIEVDKEDLDIFKSSLAELFTCLASLDEILSNISYTDLELFSEANLFISGGFEDIKTYLKDLEKHPDSKELKEKNHLKLNLLKDWAEDLKNKLPSSSHVPETEEKLKRYVLFRLGTELFATPEDSIIEILNISAEEISPIEDEFFYGMITHRDKKLFIYKTDRFLGEDFAKTREGILTLLVVDYPDYMIGLEVEKIEKISELDESKFTHVEEIIGTESSSSINHIALLEGTPIFVFGQEISEYQVENIIPYHLLGDAN